MIIKKYYQPKTQQMWYIVMWSQDDMTTIQTFLHSNNFLIWPKDAVPNKIIDEAREVTPLEILVVTGLTEDDLQRAHQYHWHGIKVVDGKWTEWPACDLITRTL